MVKTALNQFYRHFHIKMELSKGQRGVGLFLKYDATHRFAYHWDEHNQLICSYSALSIKPWWLIFFRSLKMFSKHHLTSNLDLSGQDTSRNEQIC